MAGKRKLSETHNEDRTKLQKLNKSALGDGEEINEENRTNEKIKEWENDSVSNGIQNTLAEEETVNKNNSSDTKNDVADQLKDDKDEHQENDMEICEEQVENIELAEEKGTNAETTEGKDKYKETGTEKDMEKKTKKKNEKEKEMEKKMEKKMKNIDKEGQEETPSKQSEKEVNVNKDVVEELKHDDKNKKEKADISTLELVEEQMNGEGVTEAVDKSTYKNSEYVKEMLPVETNGEERKEEGQFTVEKEVDASKKKEKNGEQQEGKSQGNQGDKDKTKKEEVNETKREETKKEETKNEETKKEETKNEETKKEETKNEDTKKEETKKEETKKEETQKEETKKEETQKEETQKEETKKEETKKEETKEEETNEVKKEQIEKHQDVQTMQKANVMPPINDVSKGQYMYGTAGGENKMYNMTMDNSYVNYSTNYLEQYYNTTANCYSDMSKGSMYSAYHNQHSMNTSSNNTTVVTPLTQNPMSTNVNDIKKGKKHGYPGKNMYETEYKMDDKTGNYTKMSNMYLNNYMNHPTSGAMPTHMVSPLGGNVGNTMGGNPVNYPGPVLAPLPTAAPAPTTAPVPMPGGNMNPPAAMPPLSNNPVDNYYMYNYNYLNNPGCSNYYYMYDNKGYEYHPKEAESEKAYDFSAVIDKSLEIMKRNNKVKEILKHPARLQITPEELNKYEYTEGSDNYNIWFGKYVTDRYDKSAKHITRFVAKYKCNPQKDSGYTKADRVYNNKQFFCIYFARGCCAYGSNCLYKHRVPTENDELEFEHTVDIFGREKFSTYKDDMSGVGCFNSDCRTLFIGSVFINNFNDAPKVEKLLYDEFSNFGNVDYVRFIPNKNIAFVQYSNRVNAEFAKVAMSDQPLENHSTALTIKWAYEFKHPPNSYGHYYNTPYIYNQNQMISPTWGNYLMQQQYGNNNVNSYMRTHMNGHPPVYSNNGNVPAMYTDYSNMYSAHYKKNNDRCNNINNNVH